MANFRTHMIYTAAASGAGASLLVDANLVSSKEAFVCWLAGLLGGLLPDVDSDNPHSAAIIFALLGIAASVVVVANTLDHLPLTWVWFAAGVTFAVFHYGLRYLFEATTDHRGAFHSVIAGLLSAAAITVFAGLSGSSSTASWFYGLFVFAGFIIHLLLDELYGVDFANNSIKRPRGRMFKLFDYQNPAPYGVMAVAVLVILVAWAPPHQAFVNILIDTKTYSTILANISPS